MTSIAYTIFGIFYCGFLPSFWVQLRNLAVPAANSSALAHWWPTLVSRESPSPRDRATTQLWMFRPAPSIFCAPPAGWRPHAGHRRSSRDLHVGDGRHRCGHGGVPHRACGGAHAADEALAEEDRRGGYRRWVPGRAIDSRQSRRGDTNCGAIGARPTWVPVSDPSQGCSARLAW